MQQLRRPLRMEDLCYQVLACRGQAGFIAKLTLGEACGVGVLPFVSSPQIRKKDAEQDASRRALWYLSLSGTSVADDGSDSLPIPSMRTTPSRSSYPSRAGSSAQAAGRSWPPGAGSCDASDEQPWYPTTATAWWPGYS
mmetsp:Transcript_403/g.1347  ORF Transcript_403/g.1347 Transcript_403/m.1347 type:complete len:139 (-) Transcript_403:60-476(-)